MDGTEPVENDAINEAMPFGADIWTLKLISSPMLTNTNSDLLSVIACATKQSSKEDKFLRIPLDIGLSLRNHCQISAMISGSEKFNPLLNKFLKSDLLMNVKPMISDLSDGMKRLTSHRFCGVADFYDILNMSDLPEGELVNVEGIIKEKWLELDKYSNMNSGLNRSDSMLSHVNLELKLVSRNDEQTVISLYIRQWENKGDLLGLIRGSHIQCSSVLKVTSKRSNAYLVTTFFTHFQIIQALPFIEQSLNVENDKMIFIKDVKDSSSSSCSFKCLFSLDVIYKLSISALCHFCSSLLSSRICSFVGCHSKAYNEAKIVVNATFRVEDATGGALLVVNKADHLKKILKLSFEEWSQLENEAKNKGELLYLHGKKDVQDNFHAFCALFPSRILCQFWANCRQFKKKNEEDHFCKLYCIDVR